ncbi:iron-containing alcohol dehydrogenase [Alkalimarinus sediminis]|uniref:Iron-containing alcohol dehydrogenase n=1 Tax=Alkalimarinus sediminis TaxID=1632866 RepID=A0A9E8HHE7_9ALTE|nr:iron-containing alcohol dehydrogenase [Alkalimarinus sediminis]UZW74469.1 iron-containing alcohol dehydrogenase [Alkalimarinus sediminis]
MLFSLQVKGYQGLMGAMKFAAKVVPMPKPTLFTGIDSSLELCDAIGQMGTKKILIVTDAMLVKLGVLDKIQKKLTENNIEFVIYDGVLPDPTYDQVENGLNAYKQNKCEAILAVGGGSPIDAAKVIAARATNNRAIKKLAGMFKVWSAPAPLFAIPTTAGTGSEVTIAAVVSDPVTHQKTPLIDPKLVPMMAALDAGLMTGLPAPVTSATGMDALTHAVEAFISKNASAETDGYAIAATRLIMENLSTAVKKGDNIEARQNMALASYYAGLAFTKASLGYVHAISHNFGAKYSTPHGLGNAIVLPYVLDYSKAEINERLAELAKVSGLKTGKESNSELAQKFIDKIRAMLKEFNIPEKLEALKPEDIPEIARLALKEAHYNYPVPKYMDQETCEEFIKQMVA